MKKVTIRVPATTANLGPGFDAFGCALSLYTDVTFEETEEGLEITGCPEEFTGPDNLVYTSYCAVLNTMSEEVRVFAVIGIDSFHFRLSAFKMFELAFQLCNRIFIVAHYTATTD